MLWYITTHYYSTCFIHDVMHDVIAVACAVRMHSGRHLSLGVVSNDFTHAWLGISCFPFPSSAGVDFSTAGFPRQVTIPAGQTTVQFKVRLINELLVERDEQFQVSFTYSGSQPGVVVNSDFDEAIITIRNDDS